VVLDIQMPLDEGLATVAALRAHAPALASSCARSSATRVRSAPPWTVARTCTWTSR
jgi:hypothetical protein